MESEISSILKLDIFDGDQHPVRVMELEPRISRKRHLSHSGGLSSSIVWSIIATSGPVMEFRGCSFVGMNSDS
eukprot:scaffold28855_cov80-Attheya_sp.AAC.2